mmetsp:Transcript_527/g.2160  ORF Transcript_527/g.2160 Transcript_527/m.2160 type:complete len:318 (-) Transcript_527:664-1617(-)
MARISGTTAWSTNASKPNTSLRSEDAASIDDASPTLSNAAARSAAPAAARHGRREPSSPYIATVPIAATNGSAGVRCGNISSERFRYDGNQRCVARERPCERNIATAATCAARTSASRPCARHLSTHGMTLSASTDAPSSAPPGSAPPGSAPPGPASLGAAYGTSLRSKCARDPSASSSLHATPPPQIASSSATGSGKSDSHVALAKRADRASSDANAFATSLRRVAYLGSGVLANSSRAKASMAASAGETSSADTPGERSGTPRSRASAARNGPWNAGCVAEASSDRCHVVGAMDLNPRNASCTATASSRARAANE